MTLVHSMEDDTGAIVRGQRGQKLSRIFDLTWHDLAVTTVFLQKLAPY